MGRPTSTRDITLGLVVTGARAGRVAGRLALLPVRVAARTPVVGAPLRRAARGLNADGRNVRLDGRRRLELAADQLLAAPEIERTVDRALAGPLADSAAHSFAEHRVAERLAAEIVAMPEFEDAVAGVLEHDATRRIVDRALASPGLERLVLETLQSRLAAEVTARVLESPELDRAVEHVASSPAVRSALTRQTTTLADELAAGVRDRAESLDGSMERKALGVLRRVQVDPTRMPYAGLATRAVGLSLDLMVVLAVFLGGAAIVGLAASLVGQLRPEWLVAALAGAWWTLVTGAYFVLFWSVTGQTPGQRLMRLRVVDMRSTPPGPGRSVLRLVGLFLAIAPLFAGFLPVLFDRRRRGLHDFLAGTFVMYADREPPLTDTVRSAVTNAASSHT